MRAFRSFSTSAQRRMKEAKAACKEAAIASCSSDDCGKSGKAKAPAHNGAQQPAIWLRCLTCSLELLFFCWSMGVRLSEVSAGCGHSPVVPAGPPPAWCSGSLLQRTAVACKHGRCLNPATFLAVGDWAMVYYILVASASVFGMLFFPRLWKQRGLWIHSAVAIRVGTIALHLVQLLRLGPSKVFFLSTVVHSLQKSRSGLVFLGYWAALSLSVPLHVHLWASGLETTLAVCVSTLADIGTHGGVRITMAQVLLFTMVMYVLPMLFILLQHPASMQQQQHQRRSQAVSSFQRAHDHPHASKMSGSKTGSSKAVEGVDSTATESCSQSVSLHRPDAQLRHRAAPAAHVDAPTDAAAPVPGAAATAVPGASVSAVPVAATADIAADGACMYGDSDYASATSSGSHAQLPLPDFATYNSAALLQDMHASRPTPCARPRQSLAQSLPTLAAVQPASKGVAANPPAACAAVDGPTCTCAPKPARRSPGACLRYQAKTQVKAMSIKVYHHPGTYEQYATVLTASALNQVAHHLHAGQQGKGAWILQAACVRGCVQLLMWLVSPAAAYAANTGETNSTTDTGASSTDAASSSIGTEILASVGTTSSDALYSGQDAVVRIQAMKAADSVTASLQGLLTSMLPDTAVTGPIDVQCFPTCKSPAGVSPTSLLHLASSPSPLSTSSLSAPASSSLTADSMVTQTWASDALADTNISMTTDLHLLWVENAVLDVAALRAAQHHHAAPAGATDLSFEAWAPALSLGNAASEEDSNSAITLHVRAATATVVRVLLIDVAGHVVLEQQCDVTAGYDTIRVGICNIKLPRNMQQDFAALHLVLTPPPGAHPPTDSSLDTNTNPMLVYASTRVLLLPPAVAAEVQELWTEMVLDLQETQEGLATAASSSASTSKPQGGLATGATSSTCGAEGGLESMLMATAWDQHYQPVLQDLAFLADYTSTAGGVGRSTVVVPRVDSCDDLMGHADSNNPDTMATPGVACSQGANTLARETVDGLACFFDSLGMAEMVTLLEEISLLCQDKAVGTESGDQSGHATKQCVPPGQSNQDASGLHMHLHTLDPAAGGSTVVMSKCKSYNSSSSSSSEKLLSGSTAACQVPSVPMSVDSYLCNTLADWSLGR